MLEYVRRLLLAQVRLAAQFDTAPQPEIREVTLQMEKKEQNSPEEDAPGREKRPGGRQTDTEIKAAKIWSAEQALREMARQTMRLESMQLQKSAQAQMEQTRRLEAARGYYSQNAGQRGGRYDGKLPAANGGCGHCVGSVAAVDAGDFAVF